jgi:reactive intermediate/imine deaminase
MATVERFPSQPLGSLTLPFSEAVRVGDLLFISGQLGHLPGKAELVPGGIGPETRQALENLGAALARRGLGFADIVKVTCMIADMSEWQAMNEAYTSFFSAGELPARSSFGTSGLAMGARIELEAIAAIRG